MRVAVGICTLNRPEGLDRALAGLMRQCLADARGPEVSVIVVDNSAEGRAADQVGSLSAAKPSASIVYVHEPRRGLANARNAALDAALSRGADFLLFIDDDEVPESGWLAAMVAAMDDPSAVGAVSPVYPLFTAPPDGLPPDAYATVAQVQGGRIKAGYTSSCIIRMSAVRRCGCRFDAAYNESGGEDTDFFDKLLSGGGRLAWAGDARVVESVPVQRMSVRWLTRRWYRTGLVEAKSLIARRPGAGGYAAALSRGIVRVAAGLGRSAIAVVSAPGRRDAVVASLYTVCRGAGYLAGAFGATYPEYRPRAAPSSSRP